MEDGVYSYHTFILPFILNNNRLDARAVNALIKCFRFLGNTRTNKYGYASRACCLEIP